MRKKWNLMVGLALALSLLAACTNSAAPQSENDEAGEKLSVVATIFPQYDFVREIAGNAVDLTMLLPPGSESHSFDPTPQDIIRIQNCDLFIYVGGDSDIWVNGILDSIDTSQVRVISMMDLVEAVTEEIVEGMEHDHEHSHDIDPDEIYDRALSDWQGSWLTVEAALHNGDLDEYIAQQAEENGMEFDAQRSVYLKRWSSDYPSLDVTAEGLRVDGSIISYRYIGYRLMESDSGSSVWYGFEATGSPDNAPRYIAFSDHGTGRAGEDDHVEHAEGEHQHEHEAAHYHLRYGDESFDALIEMENWSPLYFPADASATAIAEAMSGHGHAHEEAEYDEHVWTSPVNAMTISQHIADALCELDEGNADLYRANCEAYLGELETLDASFREIVQNAKRTTLIFGDRFPFRYFVDEYALDYYAAFPGCSTETEPSARTVAFLIDKVKNEEIPVVFHIEFSNQRMADTICEETGAAKRLFHSCHNVSRDDIAAGTSYLQLMTENLQRLQEAVN